MKTTSQLPKKLSDLLLLAVLDSRKIGRTPGYILDMATWHTPSPYNDLCRVCMAGSVMACELNVPGQIHARPDYGFDKGTYRALIAIDAMRRGQFGEAFDHLFGSKAYISAKTSSGMKLAEELIYDSYHASVKRAPWTDYIKAVRILRQHGL
jgi:hypothetical protein